MMQPSSIQPSILSESGAHLRPSCRRAESSNILTGKPLWWRLLFTKVAGLEFIPAISFKRTP